MLIEIPFGMEGLVFQCPMPFGRHDLYRQVFQEMQGAGVDTVVVLATIGDVAENCSLDLFDLYQRNNMDIIHFPIKDYSVPDKAALDETLDRVIELVKQGKRVAVHCHAGCGRTGMFLVELAKKVKRISGAEALSWIRLYVGCAVEGSAQESFVLGKD